MKHRGRIPLGPHNFNLVGVSDHSGYLQEGEVYVCISEPGKSSEYISGNVAISRSPTMHPGDIQVRSFIAGLGALGLNSIYPSQLVRAIGRIPPEASERARAIKGLRNCIVFSSRGE